jgi:hypothetical protein
LFGWYHHHEGLDEWMEWEWEIVVTRPGNLLHIERSTIFKNGKPSISMGHFPVRYVSLPEGIFLKQLVWFKVKTTSFGQQTSFASRKIVANDSLKIWWKKNTTWYHSSPFFCCFWWSPIATSVCHLVILLGILYSALPVHAGVDPEDLYHCILAERWARLANWRHNRQAGLVVDIWSEKQEHRITHFLSKILIPIMESNYFNNCPSMSKYLRCFFCRFPQPTKVLALLLMLQFVSGSLPVATWVDWELIEL